LFLHLSILQEPRNCNFNLGLISEELKEYAAAIEYFNKAIFYYTNSGSTEGVGIAQMEMGRVYYLQENYSQAEAALKLAESLLSKSNAKFRLAQTEDFLGDLKLSQKDEKQAVAYYTRSFQDYGSLRLTADEQRVMKKLKELEAKTSTH
jgi:tetratricopeptide (TPR) repeat protein